MAEKREKPKICGFGIANYRSFDEEGFEICNMKKINVFIGKNNCGKSNILRAIQLLKRIRASAEDLSLSPTLDSYKQNGHPPIVTVSIQAESVFANEVYLHEYKNRVGPIVRIRWDTTTGALHGEHPLQDCKIAILANVLIDLRNMRLSSGVNESQYLEEITPGLIAEAVVALQPFQKMIYISNFREIRQMGSVEDLANGTNIIPKLHSMQVPEPGHEKERQSFDCIQNYVRDLLDDAALQMEIPESKDKIVINMNGNRLPLESFGTGVHQLIIMCCAFALHDRHVVCMEEPEIHMHPELQRKLLRFMSEKTTNQYFIATHSNVFLDFLPDVNIFHVSLQEQRSVVVPVETTSRGRDVLTDLGYKASDLLQANGIIWVEGPSDRVYLNRWIKLAAPELVEGIHYLITFYGGALRAHYSARDDPSEDLVEVLRINRNLVFVMDRDGSSSNVKLAASKIRIRDEVDEDSCWITEGREIENYLRRELVEQFLSETYSKPIKMKFNKNSCLEKSIAAAMSEAGTTLRYQDAKVKYARKFAERMTMADLQVLDLSQWIDRIVSHVRSWNHMESGVENLSVDVHVEK